MLKSIFENTAKVLVVFSTIVTMVEDPGKAGQEKKKEAKELIKEKLEWLAAEGRLPGWVVSIFASDFVLDFLIDRIVDYANKENWFESSQKILSGQQ